MSRKIRSGHDGSQTAPARDHSLRDTVLWVLKATAAGLAMLKAWKDLWVK